MTAWCQVHASFRAHRKTKRLIRAIGNDGRWIPVWLWLYCVESARDGNLAKLSDQDLADVLEYSGDARQLRAALVEAEFLTSDGIVVGWKERYADKFEFYQRRAKDAAAARWAKHPHSSTPPSQNEDQTRVEGEEISKHDRASLKDASSIEPPPLLSWPNELTSEQVEQLSKDTSRPPDMIRSHWPEWRDRKIRFRDNYDSEGLAGFRDHLRKMKKPRASQCDTRPPLNEAEIERLLTSLPKDHFLNQLRGRAFVTWTDSEKNVAFRLADQLREGESLLRHPHHPSSIDGIRKMPQTSISPSTAATRKIG